MSPVPGRGELEVDLLPLVQGAERRCVVVSGHGLRAHHAQHCEPQRDSCGTGMI